MFVPIEFSVRQVLVFDHKFQVGLLQASRQELDYIYIYINCFPIFATPCRSNSSILRSRIESKVCNQLFPLNRLNLGIPQPIY